jgi:hypothetical protein
MDYRLVNDHVVSISREDFLDAPGVKVFTKRLQDEIPGFLSAVDPSWWKAPGGLTLVLTGCGCDLPMVADLSNRRWALPGCEMLCTLALRLPKRLGERFDEALAREYPKLAVALGSALPTLLKEGAGQEKWLGGEPSLHGLTHYQISGL